jgi:large subunit ribosomal protein L22
MATALTKYVRISPRKARLAADLIRGKHVEYAFNQLTHCKMKAGALIAKTLKSAIANAENNDGKDRKSLYVAEICVNPGPVMKRAKARNRGGRAPIIKRTSHFVIRVEEQSEKESKE